MHADEYPPTLYVLGTARDSGKTVACMGIIAKLLSPLYGLPRALVGYMKPMGQETVSIPNAMGKLIEADRDAVLVTCLMGLDCSDYEAVGPIDWYRGLTEHCIDAACGEDPLVLRASVLDRVIQAYRQLAVGKRAMVVEGTGQLGVGSVSGTSNADIINALRAIGVPLQVVIVARSDTLHTIDSLFPHLMALDHLGIWPDGLIINRVHPDELAGGSQSLQTYYSRVFPRLYGHGQAARPSPRILGFVPDIPDLALPTLRLLIEHFKRQPASGLEILTSHGREATARALIRRIKVLSLERGYERLLHPGDAVVVGINANASLLSLLELQRRMLARHGNGLAGLVLSCKNTGGLLPQVRELLVHSELPVLMLDYDSAEIAQQVALMPVKVQPYDALKRELIAEVYCRSLAALPGLHSAA